MSDFYRKTQTEVLKIFGATEQGLSETDVQERRRQYGFNELKEGRKKTTLEVFFEQFLDFLVIILIVAAIISAFFGKISSAGVIMAVVVLNAVLGTIQHVRAEQSLRSLKALSSPTAKVLRNGQKTEIPSKEIVVGDILYLEAGDFISADGRLLQNHSLQINESSLTGESLSVLKTVDVIVESDVPIGDKKNMVFSGSFVTNGRGVAIVTGIGMNTEIGKIAHLLGTAQEKKTPLQVSLDNFGKRLAVIIIGIAIALFSLDMIRGLPIIGSFMFAVALAVAAIPEALSSIVTIVLAKGTQKMAKQNAIIRKLPAVETLGSVSVVCSDKTGTLTQNKMKVQQVYIDSKIIKYNELNFDNYIEKKIVLMSLLCNDSVTIEDKEIGDPTEIALVDLGEDYGLDELIVRDLYPRLRELPFDSDRKLMSTVKKIDGQFLMYTKGAPDVLISRCAKIATSAGIVELTEERKLEIVKANMHFSSNGQRVLGFAYKETKKDAEITFEDEWDLIFVGLLSMTDPPRPESAQAVLECKQAGIKPIMITGDHKITAAAIARQIGILDDESEVIEGAEIEKWSDEKLMANVDKISVYARVSPEHKIRIVKAWQEKGHVVAMTGDGVNDAPALKQADIGIAMGITGTEVAKDAAAMVLTDDNFSTIVKAIANGRSIYANIQNAIRFLLAGNTGGVLSVMYASILAFPVPFTAIHLLFINLLTDSLPAIAIGLEPHNKNIMKEKPRNIKTPLLNKSFALQVIGEGFIIAVAALLAYHIGLEAEGAMTASTMAFATLCLARLFHGFNSRSRESIFKIGLFSNMNSWYALILGFVLLHAVLLLPPLRGIFEIAVLNTSQFVAVYGLAAMPLVLIQIRRLL